MSFWRDSQNCLEYFINYGKVWKKKWWPDPDLNRGPADYELS